MSACWGGGGGGVCHPPGVILTIFLNLDDTLQLDFALIRRKLIIAPLLSDLKNHHSFDSCRLRTLMFRKLQEIKTITLLAKISGIFGVRVKCSTAIDGKKNSWGKKNKNGPNLTTHVKPRLSGHFPRRESPMKLSPL